jgi:hypothetical protein
MDQEILEGDLPLVEMQVVNPFTKVPMESARFIAVGHDLRDPPIFCCVDLIMPTNIHQSDERSRVFVPKVSIKCGARIYATISDATRQSVCFY